MIDIDLGFMTIHFLYPYWFTLIPVLLLLFLLLQSILLRKNRFSRQWGHFIDPQLQPYIVNNNNQQLSTKMQRVLWALVMLLAMLLAIIALAGPSLHKKKLPAYQLQQGLVIALDLSTSMLTEDIRPNRMQQAKFKLIDLVQQRLEGQTGLVVFAGDAFSVAPLTTEWTTLAAQVEHLLPNTMPAQGSRVDRAIKRSVQLLKQAGLATGHILLLTDGVANQHKAELEAKKAYDAHYSVSVIAFGTEVGGLIPLAKGRVMKNRQGKKIISQLEPLSLQKIAQAGGGLYSEARIDNKDLEQLMAFYTKQSKLSSTLSAENNNTQQTLYHYVNDGIWLLLPLIPLFLLLFRRGYLLLLPLLLLTAQPQQAYAFEWADIWLNDNQRGKQLFEQGKFSMAEKYFNDQAWQAIAAYRQGDYQRSQQLLSTLNTADAWYNKGTVLAKDGQLKSAVSALQRALKIQPNHQDANYNLKLIQNYLAGKVQTQPVKSDASFKNKTNKANNRPQEKQQQYKTDTDNRQKKSQQPSTIQPKPKPNLKSKSKSSEAIRQQEQEDFKQQWLRNIPDDPSGLWRRKFKHQYQQRGQDEEAERW